LVPATLVISACIYDWDSALSPGAGQRCYPGLACAQGLYCNYPDKSCGTAPADLHDYCGCDGKLHQGVCGPPRVGQDLAGDGGCGAAMGEYPCGYVNCSSKGEYCLIRSDTSDGGAPYACMPASSPDPSLLSCSWILDSGMAPCVKVQCDDVEGGGAIVQCQ